jgi:hypothetical protein
MGESALATLLSTGPGVHSFSRSWRSAPGSETPSERTLAGHPGSFALLCADQPTRCEPAWTLASVRARLAFGQRLQDGVAGHIPLVATTDRSSSRAMTLRPGCLLRRAFANKCSSSVPLASAAVLNARRPGQALASARRGPWMTRTSVGQQGVVVCPWKMRPAPATAPSHGRARHGASALVIGGGAQPLRRSRTMSTSTYPTRVERHDPCGPSVL